MEWQNDLTTPQWILSRWRATERALLVAVVPSVRYVRALLLGALLFWQWGSSAHAQRFRLDRPLPYDDTKGSGYNLIAAAHNGDIPRVKKLLAAGADANVRFGEENCPFRFHVGAETWTPLIAVAQSGVAADPVGVARVLLADDADIDAADSEGGTALMAAVCLSGSVADGRRKKLALFLIERGADVNVKVGPYIDSAADRTPLHEAAGKGDLELVRALVGAGADVNARTKGVYCHTPLMQAVSFCPRSSAEEMVRFLLESGADPNARDGGGRSLLLREYGVHEFPDLVKLLIKHGALVNARDPLGNTPLHAALLGVYSSACVKSVALLIGAGADVNAVNLKGQNPMGLLAELYGEERGDILGMLVAAGAEASEPMGTDRLIAMLSETHKEVRCYAAERLGERRGQEVFDALVRSLEDPYVAAAAARSLGKLGDRRAVGPLCACIKTAAAAKNTELELRRGIVFAWEQAAEAACDAIAVLAPQESFVHMSELLQDRDTAYYGAACLAKRPDTRAELVLSRCVSDLAIPFSARAKAAEALATLGEASAVPVLLSALKSLPGPSAWQLRQSLKDSLFKLGDRRLVSTLLGLFGDQKAAVRGTAMELASRFVAKSAAPGASIDEGARSSRSEGAADELREDVVSALIGALGNDPSYSVRVIAAKGLGDLEAQDAVGPLMVAVERHSDLPYRTVSDDELIVGGSSYVLACCAKALGTIGDPSAVPVLQKALERWEEEGMDEVTDPLRDAITALTEKK